MNISRIPRCVIGTVNSAQGLIEMQRIQSMISNQTIDVGPNMREIFSPTMQIDTHRLRLVPTMKFFYMDVSEITSLMKYRYVGKSTS